MNSRVSIASQSACVRRGCIYLALPGTDYCHGCWESVDLEIVSLSADEMTGEAAAVPAVECNNQKEVDPNGLDPHAPGAKLDGHKARPSLIIGGFPRALTEVARVGTYGANKYSDGGWQHVDNGTARYTDAMYRHLLAEHQGEARDKDTELLHAAHTAWNALARLELMLRES